MNNYPDLVEKSSRIERLDIIRGLALLGILLVNMNAFVYPVMAELINPFAASSSVDGFTADALAILVRTKFYALFALLFGAGFALMQENSSGKNFNPIYLRRLLVLACFGLIHGLLVWTGDILLQYSLAGFFLWLFYSKTQSSRLWKWSVFWILLMISILWLPYLLVQAETGSSESQTSEYLAGLQVYEQWVIHFVDRAQEIYATGSFAEVTSIRIEEFIEISSLGLTGGTITILALFLLGAWLVRSERLIKFEVNRPFFQKAGIVCLLIGLPSSTYGYLQFKDGGMFEVTLQSIGGQKLYLIGSSILAFSYFCGLALYSSKFSALRILAPVGQMALSNYLLQSLVWTSIVYGYGLGLGAYLQSRTLQVILALAFFALQVIWSHWWMKRYYHGPFEWLWRSLTYLKLPPFRRGLEKTDIAFASSTSLQQTDSD